MQMKNKLKEEKGSMAVYVTMALLSFLILLVGIYSSGISVRKSQLTSSIKIKEAYEQYNNNIEQIYERQLKRLGE